MCWGGNLTPQGVIWNRYTGAEWLKWSQADATRRVGGVVPVLVQSLRLAQLIDAWHQDRLSTLVPGQSCYSTVVGFRVSIGYERTSAKTWLTDCNNITAETFCAQLSCRRQRAEEAFGGFQRHHTPEDANSKVFISVPQLKAIFKHWKTMQLYENLKMYHGYPNNLSVITRIILGTT